MIDIDESSMRIEGMGPLTIEGFGARVAESRTNSILSGQDPIEEAFGKLFSDTTVFTAVPQRRLAAACFALTPPPNADIDGPFVFMPGFLVDDGQIDPGKDSVTIPAQTYLVLKFTEPGSAVGDMRFSLTEGFWRDRAPSLGLERDDGPNIMIWAEGDYGAPEGDTTLEMWTPIKPPILSTLGR
jgi:predicted transcriptional regulator YdeE